MYLSVTPRNLSLLVVVVVDLVFVLVPSSAALNAPALVQAAAMVVHMYWRPASTGSAFADAMSAAAGGSTGEGAPRPPPLGVMLEARYRVKG